MAQSGNIVSHIAVTASAGVGGEAFLGAGRSGDDSLVAVAGGCDDLGVAVAAGAADIGLAAVFGAGGFHHSHGVIVVFSSGDGLGVAVAASAGVDLAAGLAAGGIGFHAGVAVAGGCDFLGIGFAARAGIGHGACSLAGGIHSFADAPAVGVGVEQTGHGVGGHHGAAGVVAGKGNIVIIDLCHGGIAVLDVASIHIGEIDGTGAAALGRQGAASGDKVNAGIGRGFAGVVMAPQENDVVALAGGVQRVHPGSATGIVVTALVDGHMAHNENDLGGVSRLCPGNEIGRGSGCAGAGLHVILVHGVDIVILALIHFAGTGKGVGVAAVGRNILVVGSIGVEGLDTGVDALNGAGNGCQGTAVGVVDMVAVKHDQAGLVCQRIQQGLQVAGIFVQVTCKEDRICLPIAGCRKGGHGQQRQDHNEHQQGCKHSLYIGCQFHK